MNNKIKSIIRNFSYTFSSNLISLLISVLIVLIIPKLIGIEEYGYWQLYFFYTSYVGFFQLGWNDGIYLRYGGEEYKNLDKQLFFSQFWMLTFFHIIIGVVIIIITITFGSNENRDFILLSSTLCMILVGMRAMPLIIFQATNKIRPYALVTMLDRIFYAIIIVGFLLLNHRDYKVMIMADILGKFISLLYAMYRCKDIVFNKISIFKLELKEAYRNITVGIRLMFANIASTLIIGIVRFGIENSWGVSTFGQISLTLSVSNLMMIFINALGVIMFPILRRAEDNKLANIYINLRDILMVLLLGSLVVFYPFRAVLLYWLPEYSKGLAYMAIVFPMCVYEGKMALLINTYLKTLREESAILKINLLSVLVSVVLTMMSTIIFKNLDLAIASIVLLLLFRCLLAEIYLSKLLKISVLKDIILEIILTFVFIFSGWYSEYGVVSSMYFISYIVYLFIKKDDLIRTYRNMGMIIK